MSVENAKALIAKAKEDKALSEKLKAAGVDGFEKAAAEAGHPCTVENVTEALKASGELDETALDSVAGGYNIYCCFVDGRDVNIDKHV